MANLKAVAKALLIGAALFCSFQYLAEFSPKQTWVLTIVAWLGYGLYESLRVSSRLTEGFTPFFVSVRPNWYELLRDYKIVQTDEESFWRKTDEQWHQLQNKSEGTSTPKYSALRSDIFFTVLQPRHDAYLPGLIYWDSRQRFVNEVEFEERIEEIKIEHPHLKGRLWSPELYFKPGIHGYELGLTVQEGWWKQICAADEALAKIKADTNHLTGMTRLVVAILPFSEFDSYLRESEHNDRRRKKRLAERGWKREDPDPELALLGAPDCVEHKYFAIDHRGISI
jgi:hypothetical protein